MVKKGQFKKLDSLLGSFESKTHSPRQSYQKNQYKKKVYTDDVFDFLSLIKEWNSIVGEKLAKVTIPIKNQRGTLIILSNHPLYSQQLSFMQTQIIEKIVKLFPKLNNKIKDIKFQVNESFFNEKVQQYSKIIQNPSDNKAVFHPQDPQYKKLKIEAQEKYQDIEDHELKEQLISLYLQLNSDK